LEVQISYSDMPISVQIPLGRGKMYIN